MKLTRDGKIIISVLLVFIMCFTGAVIAWKKSNDALNEARAEIAELKKEIKFQKDLVDEWQEVVIQRDSEIEDLKLLKSTYLELMCQYKTKYEEASLRVTELEEEHEKDMCNIFNYAHVDFNESAVKELFAWYLHKINNAERITVAEHEIAMDVFYEYYDTTMECIKENRVSAARIIAEEFMSCVENNMRDKSGREPGTFKVFENEIEQGLDTMYIMNKVNVTEKDLIVLEGALLKASN